VAIHFRWNNSWNLSSSGLLISSLALCVTPDNVEIFSSEFLIEVIFFLSRISEGVIVPLAKMLPTTWSFSEGLSVPIPTNPSSLTTNELLLPVLL
jgi:hypothetical protein